MTITVEAPVALSPADGAALSGGTIGTAYSDSSISASGGIGTISFSATNLPEGLEIDSSSGAITGTPEGLGGQFEVTVTATGATSGLASSTYILVIQAVPSTLSPPDNSTLSAGTTGVRYNETISASGGAAPYRYSLAFRNALPPGLSIHSSSGAISGTPTQTGEFTFTVVVSNSNVPIGGGSATYTINIADPTVPGAPTIGSAVAGDDEATVSFTAPASNGGGAITGYTVTARPGGIIAAGTSSPITVTGLTNGTEYTFTVTATNSAGTGSASAASNAATPKAALPAPVASSVTATVSANSTSNPITLALSGGTATSVAVVSGASHGTATVSGTTITYTPTAGYSGSDSFTYTATNATGTSASATITITISAPTFAFSPASGSLPAGTASMAYSQTVAASGGTAPYAYAVTSGSLPAGVTLNTSAGAIAGTPTADGTYNFTITATDANGATGTAPYSIVVDPAVSFTFSPGAGVLPEAMAGEDYSQSISATGGTGSLIYSLASGTLPDGIVLNISTGDLTGPVDVDAEVKDYTFTIEVRDGNGATGTATYTLEVKERAVTVTDQERTVPDGAAPANVDLTKGATGGPFVDADIVSVEPSNAGAVSIVRGEFAAAGPVGPLGWYLKFIPNPAYSGQAMVRFRLTSALGVSNTGVVTYALGYDAGEVAADMDTLVHGFVQSRQNLISSTIEVPGLVERRQMANAADPVTGSLRPSATGITTTLSTSLVQMEAAANNADGLAEAELSPFNIWIDATFMQHNREQNGDNWGSFGMVSTGADYLLNEMALIGLSFHYDRMTDPTDADAELTGNGWLAGPYASFELGNGVFWDTSLLVGGSSNTIDTQFWGGSFDTRRWLFDTSISGQWLIDDVTTLTPKLRAVYFSETVADYAVENGSGDVLDVGGFTAEQLRVSLGAEIARQFTLENGLILTPKLGLTGGFSGLDGSGAFGQVSAGLSLQTTDAWSIDAGLLFNIEGDGQTSAGAKVGISGSF